MCYQDCLQETTVSRMWQCEDSHSSTRAEIADLLGQSLPVRFSTGKKKVMVLGLKLSLTHCGKQGWVETTVPQQSMKNVQHTKSVDRCVLVPVAGEIWDSQGSHWVSAMCWLVFPAPWGEAARQSCLMLGLSPKDKEQPAMGSPSITDSPLPSPFLHGRT